MWSLRGKIRNTNPNSGPMLSQLVNGKKRTKKKEEPKTTTITTTK